MILKHFTPALIWSIVVFILYAIPGSAIPSEDWWNVIYLDKIAHFTIFLILAALLYRGFIRMRSSRGIRKGGSKWIPVFIVAMYGVILELVQGTIFVERYTEMADLIANVLGAIAGVYLFHAINARLLSK